MEQFEVLSHSKSYLQKALASNKPYTASIAGTSVKINPLVFPTATDTKLLAEFINISDKESFLDLTTGCGIIAVLAGLQGAKGIAIDINPHAIKNAKENIKKFNLSVDVILSDMFEQVPHKKYDVMFCNAPYYDAKEGDIKEKIDHALYGGKTYLKRLFTEMPRYLSNKGKLLITWAEWADADNVEKEAEKFGYKWKVLGKRVSDDGKRVYRLYEITVNKWN